MEGYLLKEGHVLRNWKKRFCKLNAHLGLLEYFSDDSLKVQKGKILLHGGEVKKGDQIGTLITGKSCPSDRRRFVFRITDRHSDKVYFFCADLEDNMNRNKQYFERWVYEIQKCIQLFNGRNLTHPSTSSKLSSQCDQSNINFTAKISGVRLNKDTKLCEFEVSCKAWIANFEAISWNIWKEYEDFENLDNQLRCMHGKEVKNILFPDNLWHNWSNYLPKSAIIARLSKSKLLFNNYLQEILFNLSNLEFNNYNANILHRFLEFDNHVDKISQRPLYSGKDMQTRQKNSNKFERACGKNKLETHCQKKHRIESQLSDSDRNEISQVEPAVENASSIHDRIARVGKKLLMSGIE